VKRSSSSDSHFSRPGVSARAHDLAPHRWGATVWLEVETVDLLDTRVPWERMGGNRGKTGGKLGEFEKT
jgi:hypothetical protein